MNLTIIGRKCTLHDNFKERAEKRLKKVERLFGEDAQARVTATVEKNHQTVEVTVNKGGMIFRAEERAESMNDALDKCVDSLIRQIRKNKTRIEKKIHSGAIDELITVENGGGDIEEKAFDVIREKNVALKPQSVDEAILQMNLLDHQFYLFLNAETGDVNVVYKRRDAGYGLLIPDIDK